MYLEIELLKMQRDLNNKLNVYGMYVSRGEEPPKELLGSISSLDRLIKSTEVEIWHEKRIQSCRFNKR